MEGARSRVRFVWPILLVAIAAAPLRAQSNPVQEPDVPQRRFTLTFTLENTLVGDTPGWLGAGAEVHLADGRLSAFGGLGYTPAVLERADPSGLSYAAGARAYTDGLHHRLFLEASFRQVGVGQGELLHGPGLQAGYQYASDGGFTLLVSAGVGYEIDAEVSTLDEGFQPLMSVGLGHTWR